ncbi:MAG: NAD-dependent epimerase/dehydratase family protein, partial [Mangrovicoccus sp.]|nr:NAD-dependent epimerase/dehydratase family protein [Mangrovicoccus sp.]
MTALKGKHVLVTGGTGFVGSHIVDLLLQAGCARVIVIDNMVRGRIGNLVQSLGDPRLSVVQADIRDAGLMRRLLDGIEIVYHQAALRITHCAAEPDQAMQVMVEATQSLLDLCVERRVEKVIFASSASVYGMADSFPTDETHHPYNNRTLYGAAKTFGEGLLRSYNDMYGLNYVALRYFNVYGPRMDLHGRYTEVLVRWMERLDSGAPPIIFGDGLQTMDMIHVTDVARANILAAQAPVSDVVLNVASQTETSLLDLAHGMAAAMGRPELKPVHQAARAINPVPRRLGSARLAESLIGFRATVPLDGGLRGLVDWWRQ